jgi:hypothetical protein
LTNRKATDANEQKINFKEMEEIMVKTHARQPDGSMFPVCKTPFGWLGKKNISQLKKDVEADLGVAISVYFSLFKGFIVLLGCISVLSLPVIAIYAS